MLYQAHRGVSLEYPENTMPAFTAAVEQGYQVIELDLDVTRDQKIVVHHDKTIQRTARTAAGEKLSQPLAIADLTYDQLAALDFGLWFSEAFRGTAIPLFSEVLALARQAGVKLKIDNKFQRFDRQQMALLFEQIKPYEDLACLTCSDPALLQEVAAMFPRMHFHYDGAVSREILEQLHSFLPANRLTVWLAHENQDTTWVKVGFADPRKAVLVKQYASLGLWILSQPEHLAQAMALGADIIETHGQLKPGLGLQTKALRLHGADDVRLQTIALPPITEDEVLIRVVSDSVCASTYKAIRQGPAHKRVPENVAQQPVIVGHELCGEVLQVGAKAGAWQVGQKVVLQPALKLPSGYDPGYSYPWVGGNTQYAVVPKIVLERGCLLPYRGDSFFAGSLAEALGCIIRGYKGLYHTDYTNYVRKDGAKKGGKVAILGGAGPMGIGAVELAIGYAGVSTVVVTDLNQERLDFAAQNCSVERAKEKGVQLHYVNTSAMEDPVQALLALSGGGFDDVFVMVPVPALFTMAERICAEDGCINFFAGPPVHDLQGSLNLYRVHYDGIHVVGTAGSIPEDMEDVLRLMESGKIQAGALVSHILGLNAAAETLFAMEKPDGAKKVCYNALDLPLTAIADFERLGKTDPMFAKLHEITQKNGGLWCAEAEAYLLQHCPKL